MPTIFFPHCFLHSNMSTYKSVFNIMWPVKCVSPLPSLYLSVGSPLTVSTREAPVSARSGSALSRPVSVSDRVAPYGYISEKTEHAACSVFSFSTELETHPALLLRLHTIFEHCHIFAALIFLVFGWKAGLSSRLLYSGKVCFFLQRCALFIFTLNLFAGFTSFLWFAGIMAVALM